MQLRGTNALLTGAAGGLGEYIARALAAQGVNLALSDIPGSDLDDFADELRRSGIKVELVPADLRDRGDLENLVPRAEEAVGPLDVLVNNAGIEFGGSFLIQTSEELEAIVEVNLLAVMELTRHVLPGMIERGRGHVVSLASIAGKTAAPNLASYAATKHGVVGFTHSMRGEFAEKPVSFSAICPIFISRVGMYGRLEDEVKVEPPRMFRPEPPEAVGAAVVKAITEDRAEVIVAGRRPFRVLAGLYWIAPKLMMRLTANVGAREFQEEFSRVRGRPYT